MKTLKYLLLLSAFILVGGCSTQTAHKLHTFVESNKFVLRTAIKAGAVNYVTKSAVAATNLARAARVLRVTKRVRGGMNDKEMQASRIYDLFFEAVMSEDLTPVERVAATELLASVKIRIDNLIQNGNISYDAKTTAYKVLDLVESTVKPFSK